MTHLAHQPVDGPVREPMETYSFKGFDIPLHLLLMTGAGPETFEEISSAHIRDLQREQLLSPGVRVLELGCGIGRDAIPLAELVGPGGSYLGIDIIRDSIDWCTRNITARYPNVLFHYDDLEDSLHNPTGLLGLDSVQLPVPDHSVNLVVAQSVFTHMLRPAFSHYLDEFVRVLAPGGAAYTTCFRVSPEILHSARRRNLTAHNLRFEHDLGEGCFVNELVHLTGAVAYEEWALRGMVERSGLRLRGDVRPGAWSGHFPAAYTGQDVLVLEHA